jgi:hypothetical protein
VEKTDILKLQETEDRSKSNMKRLDEHDIKFKEMSEKLEDIHELTYSVKTIANETKLMREDVNKLDIRVGDIEKEPAKEYKESRKEIRKQIISFVLGIILMFLAFKLGLKDFV